LRRNEFVRMGEVFERRDNVGEEDQVLTGMRFFNEIEWRRRNGGAIGVRIGVGQNRW
jgi:hypothetical protein